VGQDRVVAELNYDRRGSGPPLLMVHGLGSRWQVFEPILDKLAKHRDVISVDLPGFGGSAPDPAVENSVPGYARRVAEFARDLGLDKPAVCGNSMGGGVALELGRTGVASRVVAFAPVGFWTALELRWCLGLLATMRATSRLLRPVLTKLVRYKAGRVALLNLFFGHPAQVPPDVAIADMAGLVGASAFPAAARSMIGYDLRGGLDLDVPVTIAWGSRDRVLIYRSQSARARAALPSARHETLPGCGHLPFLDDPQRCAALVLEGA
jgi:pimeloyl-ACP methyl ester carboxylesterase